MLSHPPFLLTLCLSLSLSFHLCAFLFLPTTTLSFPFYFVFTFNPLSSACALFPRLGTAELIYPYFLDPSYLIVVIITIRKERNSANTITASPYSRISDRTISMPQQLLPASARAFETRSKPNIVLSTKVDPWLTATLKRVNRIKRPLNSVPQHFRCLTETLSSESAIWTLCTLCLPRAPETELVKDSNPLVEGLFNYQMLFIEAYVVHVDLVSQNEVAFKLTTDTITALVEYHRDIWCVDAKANTHSWSEKDTQVKKLQDDFYQAAHKFVYRTNAMALEGLEEDGAGELLCGRAEEVKTAIMGMFLPLLPPPPRPVEAIRATPVLPSSVGVENWWQPSLPSTYASNTADSWKYTSTEPMYTSADSGSGMWANMDLNDFQLPAEMSPTSTYSESYASATPSPPQFYSLPVTTNSYTSEAMVTEPITASSLSAPMTQSMDISTGFAHQQCSPNVGFTFGGFDWESYNHFAPPLNFAM